MRVADLLAMLIYLINEFEVIFEIRPSLLEFDGDLRKLSTSSVLEKKHACRSPS